MELFILILLFIIFKLLLISIVGFKFVYLKIVDNIDVVEVFLCVLEIVIEFLYFFMIWFKKVVLFIINLFFFLVVISFLLFGWIVVV